MKIVLLTPFHRITGEVELGNIRLSDYLNARAEAVITLTDASFSVWDRTESVIDTRPQAFVPKHTTVLAFEAGAVAATRAELVVPKQPHPILVGLDQFLVRGDVHALSTVPPGDIPRRVATSDLTFMPLTNATVTVLGRDTPPLELRALIMNVTRIRFTTLPG